MPTLKDDVRFVPHDDDVRFTPIGDDDVRFEPAPDLEPTVSARAVVQAPGQMEFAPRPLPQNNLELEQQAVQQRAEATTQEGRLRERTMFTPEQIRRLDEGSVAENLMTAPPGVEAPMVTGEQVLQRFPTMTTGNAKILAGILQTAAGAWNFAASPVGAATMPVAALAGAPGLAGLAGKSVLGTFAVEAFANTPGAIEAFIAATETGDPEQIAQTASQLALNTAVALGAGKGTIDSARAIPTQERGAIVAQARAKGLEQSAAAIDQFAKDVGTVPIQRASPDQSAIAAMRPSAEAIATPEALRRPNEVQLTEVPTTEQVGEMAPSHMLPREIQLEVSEGVAMALDRYNLAKQRQAERATREEGGQLDTSGETFSGIEQTPGFLQTAEQRLANRPDALDRPTIPPEITTSTPLKDVEQIVRDKLEQRDWVDAVATLGQTSAETSRKVIDKLLGVGREAVPLQAAEKTIFNAIWDESLRRAGAGHAVMPEAPDLIQRLESLKTPLTPGVGANPFPEIAKAVWNTSLDIAINAIKAGTHIKAAIDEAISHLKKNAAGFDETKVRSYINDLLLKESAATKAVAKVDEARKEIAPPAVAPTPPGPQGTRFGDIYSEPIVERVGRIGKGPVSKAVARESLQVVDTAKRIIGELNATVLDDAKRAAGSLGKDTTWMQGVREVTPRAAVGRFHDTLETRARTGSWEHVPEEFRPLAEKLWNANLAIGKIAEKASPLFKATGEAQRMLTSYGMDVIQRGGGKAWEAWAEGLAKANDMDVSDAKAFLKRWKAEMDQPGWDTARLDKIAQDFKRQFPNVVTHIKPFKAWHEIVHSSPFKYLDQASQRTAHAVAFREVYPLIKDAETGKYHGSGKLEATRKAVMAEMETAKHGEEFDNLMLALQGHPIDNYSRWWNAPDTMIGASVRAMNDAAQPLFSAMLSATSPRNVGEIMSGGAQIFLGYRRVIESALKERKAYSDLERLGMVNRAILDFSFDPSSPGRSTSRIASNTIRKVFAEQIANEFQEFTAAAAARVIANEIREGRLPAGDTQNVIAAMRAMGIAYDDALAAVAGRNESAVKQFETKAAEFLYGGNRATSEASPLGANRAFTSLFKWHSYPMTKLRQLRSVISNLTESAQRKDTAQVYANSVLLAKQIGGTALAGAITTGVMALIYEGLYGVEIRKNEARQDFPEFVKDSYIMAMGGPIQVLSKMVEEGGDVQSWIAGVINAAAPVGVANDFSRMVLGMGQYEGLNSFEKVAKFVESKTPFSRAIRRGMSVFELSKENPGLDSAIGGFKRWQRDKFGFNKFESHMAEGYDNAKFRGHMKKAVTALRKGDSKTYDAEIESALSMEGVTSKNVKQSLRGRKILSRPKGEKLTDEDEEELKNIIGEKGLELIGDFDLMLNSIYH